MPGFGSAGLSSSEGISSWLLVHFRGWSPPHPATLRGQGMQGSEKACVDQSQYCGHSFRIGAATTGAAKGLEDCIKKTLGRWESLAYLRYLKLSHEQLGGYSAMLVS